MARHLLQLKLQSIANSLRRDSPDRGGAVASIVASAGLAVLALLLVVVLWDRDAELRGSAAIVGGTLLTLGSFFVSASTFEAEAVDPRALVFAGVSPKRASWKALLTSFIGVAPACLVIVLCASVILWRDDRLSLGFAAAGAVVSFAMAVTLGRLGALVGRISSDRRVAGDVMSATFLVALLAASPIAFVLVSAPWQSGAGTVVGLIADGLAWSPFGGSWAAAASAATAGPIVAAVQLGISSVTLILFLIVWMTLATRVAQGTIASRRMSGELELGMIGVFGNTAAGAIAARTLTYWLRDRRYRVVLTAVIFIPLLALVPLAFAGVPTEYLALLPVPLLGFFFGWALHNDLAFDSTALWLHITASMDGRSDRLGRALPTLVIGGMLVLLGSAVTGLITGEWMWSISVLGVALCLLAAATGISSVTSVLYPYAVARPGDSPFSQPVRSWGSGVWMHPVTGLLAFVAAAPAVVFGVVGIATGGWWWHVLALIVGVAAGAVVLRWGLAEGGRRYEAASSELMTFATSA